MRGFDLGGLGVAGVGAGVNGLGQVEEIAGRAQHEDRGLVAIRLLPGVLDDAVAGAVGQPHVHHQAVGHARVDHGAGLVAGAGLANRDALVLQHGGQQATRL